MLHSIPGVLLYRQKYSLVQWRKIVLWRHHPTIKVDLVINVFVKPTKVTRVLLLGRNSLFIFITSGSIGHEKDKAY